MSIRHKLIHEIKVVALTTLYFAAWFCSLILLKTLVLAEHQIRFSGISLALVGGFAGSVSSAGCSTTTTKSGMIQG